MLTETAEWTTALPLAAAVRLISRTRAFNVIVTNVPGPPVPFYLLDAPMVAGYPHVPLFENQGLGIALLSYAGRFSFGLVGEWDLLPDIDRLAAAIEAAFAGMLASARDGADGGRGHHDAVAEHRALRDAALAGRGARAATLLQAHLQRTLHAIRALADRDGTSSSA